MKFKIEVVCLDDINQEQRHTVLTIERAELAMETLGMSLGEGKALLSGVQDFVIEGQSREYLQQHRACRDCGRLYTSKDAGRMVRSDRGQNRGRLSAHGGTGGPSG